MISNCSEEGLTLRTSLGALMSSRWPNYLINSVDKTKHSFPLPTDASLRTQTYFRLSLLSDSRKCVCVRRLHRRSTPGGWGGGYSGINVTGGSDGA